MGIHQENNDLSGIKALVVDDNQFHAEFIREMLEDAKATVVLAFSGEEALAVLEKMHDFSCVIMDTLMPGMDGFATAERIRRMASPELHVLPIIGMLSHKNKDDHEKVFAIGMNGVLTKPISPTKLYEEVNRLHHNTFLAQHGNRESLKGLSAYVLVRDRGVCDAIGQHLEDNGLQVVRYYELKDVLDMANENRRYDFAFVEWDDSAEDGSELARQVTLFAQNTFKHLIAVIKDWSTIESQALGLGIDAYINTSPTRMETLNVLQKVMHDDELKAKQTSEDFKGVRILIADDNVTNAMIMQNAMEAFGATADIAQSGSEAFEKLKNAPEKYYQMAFLDIFMP
ncbi:MAG: response regulator, partial [Victivallales bacterium]|nr:response regulator [Victivallales bacterium]